MSEMYTHSPSPVHEWSGSQGPSRVPSRASSRLAYPINQGDVLSHGLNADPAAVGDAGVTTSQNTGFATSQTASPGEQPLVNPLGGDFLTDKDGRHTLLSSSYLIDELPAPRKTPDGSPPLPQLPPDSQLTQSLTGDVAKGAEAPEAQAQAQAQAQSQATQFDGSIKPSASLSPPQEQGQDGYVVVERMIVPLPEQMGVHQSQDQQRITGEEVLDPSLRDQSTGPGHGWGDLPPIRSSSYTSQAGSVYDPGEALPQMQPQHITQPQGDFPPPRQAKEPLATNANSDIGSTGKGDGTGTGTGAGIWSLPPLQAPFTFPHNGLGAEGSGTDTQPSTQTNSPSSPTDAEAGGTNSSYRSTNNGGLWASASGCDSTTDLSTYPSGPESLSGLGAGHSTTEGHKGMSANSSESGFDYTTGNDNATGPEESGVGEGKGVPPPPKKKSHARKQPEGHIKRARNAFILFRKHITDSNLIPPTVEVKHQNISVVAAKMWKEAPQEVRQKFQEQARIEKEEHQRKYPGYRYQPVFRRTDIIRRRVRKDPAEDDKVEAVAEALIKGKAGDSLETEIKEQMISRSEASESEAESVRSTSRRRRRDVGQLSKGAIRAQRAQARAKQMRQNLLGTNLLNMSLYNAATNRLASSAQHASMQAGHTHAHAHVHLGSGSGYPSHPGAAHYAQTGIGYGMEGYMPMGYDFDGQPVPVGHGQSQAQGYGAELYPAPLGPRSMGMPEGTGHESEMYRLPAIEGMMDVGTGYETWQPQVSVDHNAQQVEYWDPPLQGDMDMMGHPGGYAEGSQHPRRAEDYYASTYELAGPPPPPPASHYESVAGPNGMEFRLPPLIETSREGSSIHPDTYTHAHGQGHVEIVDRPGDIIANQYVAAGSGSDKESNVNPNIRVNGSANVNMSENDRIQAWSRDAGQQTPSGHVLFNERLFDGALGTSGMQDQDRRDAEDGLGIFDQAMEQAGEVGSW